MCVVEVHSLFDSSRYLNSLFSPHRWLAAPVQLAVRREKAILDLTCFGSLTRRAPWSRPLLLPFPFTLSQRVLTIETSYKLHALARPFFSRSFRIAFPPFPSFSIYTKHLPHPRTASNYTRVYSASSLAYIPVALCQPRLSYVHLEGPQQRAFNSLYYANGIWGCNIGSNVPLLNGLNTAAFAACATLFTATVCYVSQSHSVPGFSVLQQSR